MSYGRFDAVLVQFPFSEKKGRKQRPAIVLSDREFNAFHQNSVMTMVTTASLTKWPSDLTVRDYVEAGLHSPCFVRAKLFTIADELVIGRIGTLTEFDCLALNEWTRSLVLRQA